MFNIQQFKEAMTASKGNKWQSMPEDAKSEFILAQAEQYFMNGNINRDTFMAAKQWADDFVCELPPSPSWDLQTAKTVLRKYAGSVDRAVAGCRNLADHARPLWDIGFGEGPELLTEADFRWFRQTLMKASRRMKRQAAA